MLYGLYVAEEDEVKCICLWYYFEETVCCRFDWQ